MTTRKNAIVSLTALTLGAATLLSAGALSAREGHGGRDRGEAFEVLDANGDGQVTQDEMQARALARFTEADANGDGKLSAEEMAAAAEKRIQQQMDGRAGRIAKRTERLIERRDTDGDGLLSLAEMAQGGRHGDRGAMFFERFDANGDGVVTLAEFNAVEPMFKRGPGKARNN